MFKKFEMFFNNFPISSIKTRFFNFFQFHSDAKKNIINPYSLLEMHEREVIKFLYGYISFVRLCDTVMSELQFFFLLSTCLVGYQEKSFYLQSLFKENIKHSKLQS